MHVTDAYKCLTEAARRESLRTISAMCMAEGEAVSQDYIRQVLTGLRSHPCSERVARIISGYFRGYRGIDVAPDEVTGMKPEGSSG
jgi:hypothetical protein